MIDTSVSSEGLAGYRSHEVHPTGGGVGFSTTLGSMRM